MPLLTPPRYFNKFGRNPSVTKDTTEDVWDGGGTYTFTASGGVEYFISSSNDTDNQLTEIQGLDPTGLYKVKHRTCPGQTKTSIGNWLRVFRIRNLADEGNDYAGTIYVYENDTVTAGVPDTASKIRAQVGSGNQTLMAIFTVPLGYKAYIKSYLISINRDAAGGERQADMMLRVRSAGKVFRDQEPLGLTTTGTSAIYVPCDNPYPSEKGYGELTDIKWACYATVKNCDVTAKFQIRLLPKAIEWTPDVSFLPSF